jgi:hypothetical protein
VGIEDNIPVINFKDLEDLENDEILKKVEKIPAWKRKQKKND